MSYSKTKIFNIALSNLGISAPLQNSNQNDPRAILLNNYYEIARDSILEMHEWSFATGYSNLSNAIDDVVDTNFLYAFVYPNDCIAPRAIIDAISREEKKFSISINSNDEKIILTNINPCLLRYTRRIEKETLFPATFANCLALYLAYLSAQVITGSANKKNTNLQDFQIAIRNAIKTDARKNISNDEDNKDYTDFR